MSVIDSQYCSEVHKLLATSELKSVEIEENDYVTSYTFSSGGYIIMVDYFKKLDESTVCAYKNGKEVPRRFYSNIVEITKKLILEEKNGKEIKVNNNFHKYRR